MFISVFHKKSWFYPTLIKFIFLSLLFREKIFKSLFINWTCFIHVFYFSFHIRAIFSHFFSCTDHNKNSFEVKKKLIDKLWAPPTRVKSNWKSDPNGFTINIFYCLFYCFYFQSINVYATFRSLPRSWLQSCWLRLEFLSVFRLQR